MRWLALLLLTACTPTTTTIPVLTPVNDVDVPTVAPLKMQGVHWQVLTLDDLKQIVKDHPEAQFVIYALDTKNFTALTLNLNEVKRYIAEQKAALTFAVGVINERKNSDFPPHPPP